MTQHFVFVTIDSNKAWEEYEIAKNSSLEKTGCKLDSEPTQNYATGVIRYKHIEYHI